MDGLCGDKTRLSIGECHSDRRNGQSNAAGDLAGHALPARTHKTVRLVLLALALNRNYPPLLRTIEAVAKLQFNKSFSTKLAKVNQEIPDLT